jgi:hypothetical protein
MTITGLSAESCNAENFALRETAMVRNHLRVDGWTLKIYFMFSIETFQYKLVVENVH